ncbi:MAG: hypothetical protein ACOYIF_03575 [Acetivibrionales bacterium]|jgi:septal ring factor EnvC (AmiA/AmiB activator)
MASLSSLSSSLNYWNNQVNELNKKLKKLKKRRSDVEDVKRALKSTANGSASDVNNKIHVASYNLGIGITYSGKDSQLHAIFSGKAEQPLASDGNLSFADSELNRELNDIERKISETDSSLTTAKNKVRDIKAAIAAEKRQQREKANRMNEYI